MKNSLITATLTSLFMGGVLSSAQAGTISLEVLEFKGTFDVLQPVQITVPTRTIIRSCSLEIIISGNLFQCSIQSSTTILPNQETFTALVPTGEQVNLYNIYAAEIEIPQPTQLDAFIDIFWFSAANTGNGIGSLPSGMSLDSGFLTGGTTGIQYSLDITTITGLSNLPTSSANNTNIIWDTSSVVDPNGTFYLAKATLPVRDVCVECAKVPEPSSTLSLLSLGILGTGATLKRKLKGTHSLEKEPTKVE